MATLVEFADVSKCYGSKLILDKVSFKLNKGELTTLIGPNGAGKTTLAQLILGITLPSSGAIKKPSNLKISYLPQKFSHNINLPISFASFLALLMPNFAQILQDNNSFTSKVLKFSDFDNLKNHDLSSLSGGQLQKLLLTVTFLKDADLLILDEPIKSLDLNSSQEFYHLLRELKSKKQQAIFMISHDLFTVMRTSDNVLCLNRHICCSGIPGASNNSQEFIDATSEIGFYTHHHDHIC